MTTAPLDKDRLPLSKPSLSHTAIFWIGFCVVMAVLIVAPLVLPEFWRRFLTEILIWGLLAMSSDLLIGYTGMISFGHSAFFGLGMYGAAGALAARKPAESVARDPVRAGRRGRRGVVRRLFLDPAARHLFRHHHADLQPDLLRHHLHLDGGDRRRERADLHPPASDHPVPLRCALHHDDHALVRAGGGDRRPI